MKNTKRIWTSSVLLILAFLMSACSLFGKSSTDSQTDTGGEEEIPEKEVVLFGGSNDYNIIYSETSGNEIKELMSQISEVVTGATGKTPKYALDRSKSTEESPYEILLGVTSRKENTTALSSMPSIGYQVKFVGEKLCVTASDDGLLAQAVGELMKAWSVKEGQITISNKTVITKDASEGVRSLLENGEFTYKIVIPMRASDALYQDAAYLSQSLSAITGAMVDICYDERTPETDGAYEICIGKTNRQVSLQLYDSLNSVFEYKTLCLENRIAVGALQDSVISQAVRLLYSDLYSAIKFAYSGMPVLPMNYEIVGNISQIAAAVPTVGAGSFYGIYACGEDRYILYTEKIAKTDYDTYLDVLKADGAELLQEYSLGDNRYALFQGAEYTAYVSYLPMKNAMRMYVGPPDLNNPTEKDMIEVGEVSPALWQLEVDTMGSYSNGGMSYVIQLTDGSFLIIDGGYNTSAEADNLYALLRDNTPAGEKPVIAGWFISHLHTDHYGALINFSVRYADKVDVKAFYFNFPGVAESVVDSIELGAAKNIVNAAKSWKNAKRYDTIHSGMTLGFAGATVDVLCTHEDVYPMSFVDGNDTSTVLRVNIAGQRILFLGDARDGESVTMLNTIPTAELKMDIVQFSHHGYEGCSDVFYKVVGAPVVLWPMNIIGYNSGTYEAVFRSWYHNSMTANTYIRTSDTVKKIIVSGAGTQKLELPYTPTGERVPDYEAIYNERLSLYENK